MIVWMRAKAARPAWMCAEHRCGRFGIGALEFAPFDRSSIGSASPRRIARSTLLRSLSPALFLSFLGPSLTAQQEVFPARAQDVRVFVRAEKDGVPVFGLTAADFETQEDGKRVGPLTVFALDPGEPTSTQVVGAPDQRDFAPGFAIVADDYVSVEAHAAYLRDHLREFVQQLAGTPMVSLFAPASGIAIRAKLPEGRSALDAALDQLQRSSEFARVFFPGGDRGSLSQAELRALAENMRRSRLASIQAACESLGGVAGDRVVLLVMGRRMSYSRQIQDEMLLMIRRANARLFFIEYQPSNALPPMTPPTTQEAPSLPSRRGAGQPTNPGRSSFFTELGANAPMDTAHAVATDTGGFSTRGLLSSSLKLAARSAENNYLIAYGRDAAPDHRYHRIEVKVKKKAVVVAYRRGYFAN
jgi:VWFA-related protein